MRVVAELPRPDCKITIFSMNMKFIIKFEQGVLEQTFKLSEMDVTDGINGVFQLLDEEFVNSVVGRFKAMNNDFHLAYQRHEV